MTHPISLFRKGVVRVIIATGMSHDPLITFYHLSYICYLLGTLALGINAPAKTTVFCGDSPFLTALMVSSWNLLRIRLNSLPPVEVSSMRRSCRSARFWSTRKCDFLRFTHRASSANHLVEIALARRNFSFNIHTDSTALQPTRWVTKCWLRSQGC